jgi:hypothetical protein
VACGPVRGPAPTPYLRIASHPVTRANLPSLTTLVDANFPTFIGLVRERETQYGKPERKVNQTYSTDGQQLFYSPGRPRGE